jgi:acetylglutamate kinase
MVDERLFGSFAQDVTLLTKIGIHIAIVHGGGKEITDLASRLGLASRFVDGQRYTDEEMMDVVRMVLVGKTNKDIVARINRHDGGAVGISGIDARLLSVRTLEPLGLVGEIDAVNADFLTMLLDHGMLPVIAPVGVDAGGRPHNINADHAAARVAAALGAAKLVYLSDVEGVMAEGRLIHSLTRETAASMVAGGVIRDGMVPKVHSAFQAIDGGVAKVHLIDGRVPHAILLEIFTDAGIGTEIIRSPELPPEKTP